MCMSSWLRPFSSSNPQIPQAVRTTEKMDADHCHWEDAIDIDDADLPSLLGIRIIPPNNPINYNSAPVPLSHSVPSLQPCSQSRNPNPKSRIDSSPPKKNSTRRPIPGPAGAVQVAMHRKSSAAAAAQSSLFNSQLLLREEEEEEDGDFKLNPWLCAVAFLGRDFDLRWTIRSVKNGKSTGAAARIPQVVGVVKSSVPNGLGDLFIILKDPTGTIGASIHRNVLVESNLLGGDISVGCVLILKQVAVFCPGRSACYLNVTINNMVKIISRDCGPPDKHMMASSETRYGSFGKQTEIRPGTVEKLNSLRQSEVNTAGNEMRREINNARIMDYRQARNSNVSAKSDFGTTISANIASKLDFRTITTPNMVDKPDPGTNAAAYMVRKPDPRVNTAENMVSISNIRTNTTTVAAANKAAESDIRTKEPEKMISSVSVAQWTDEQLSELFADYQDDAICF